VTVLGVVALAVGVLLGGVTTFVLWRRVPAPAALALAAVAGMSLGAGMLLLRDGVGTGDWVVALTLLGVLTPIHVRSAFGAPGERG
jgi:hypothetical protein